MTLASSLLDGAETFLIHWHLHSSFTPEIVDTVTLIGDELVCVLLYVSTLARGVTPSFFTAPGLKY